ncbi:MAG: isocitrate/isopropylmalate dehydrogenase family protein [Clostridia bacterium]|nr:isocitrate/isopropylmalate dehydrogenase family protein [Clostridia bacterium]
MNEQIEQAVAAFRTLLTEQIARTDEMEKAPPPKDYKTANKIRIGMIDGDGIGPIIMREARRVLALLLAPQIKTGRVEMVDIEGLTIENRLATGKAIPADTLAAIRTCDVLLKGPTTTPKGGSMESANVAMRRELDLYANVRPVSVPAEGIDWAFFRENTEGEYVLGSRGIEIDGRLAMDFKVTTVAGTRRIARAAFEYARNNGKTNVAIVTKANIMKKTDGSFSAICHEIAKDYPEITAEDWYIDIMTANLVNEKIRSRFQVFLLPNLYGDIITDEAAQIQGGVGTAGSANIGDQYAMFEAIHGSAPRMIEEGIGEYASPESILRAAVMMLSHIGLMEESGQLADALHICSESERRVVVTGDRDGATCRAYADYLMETLANA